MSEAAGNSKMAVFSDAFREHLNKLAQHNRPAIPAVIVEEIMSQANALPNPPRFRGSISEYRHIVEDTMKHCRTIEELCNSLEKLVVL